MSIPLFFQKDISGNEKNIYLEEGTSRHITGVLRMKAGDKIRLTNGSGTIAGATIISDHKKKCLVAVDTCLSVPDKRRQIRIAISLLKNTSRFEWFLEKATEIGVSEIIPLRCARTEKQQLRMERMQHILISAMLQSQKAWLPVFGQPVTFDDMVAVQGADERLAKMIAHCGEDIKSRIADIAIGENAVLLIGPEGDFTPEEIGLATASGFVSITLGDSRLRTETAGIVGVTLLNEAMSDQREQ